MLNVQHIKRDVIVIGASAGGVEALIRLFQGFTANFQGIVATVIHRSPAYNLHLGKVLGRNVALPLIEPTHETELKPGTIYLAPRDHHMFFTKGHVELNRGPKIHFTRPAVDPLFVSAGELFGTRVVGVLLTGGGDDGVSGFISIKARQGLAIVQDPREAKMPTMPLNALTRDHVDLVLPLSEIPPTLERLARGEAVETSASFTATPQRSMG
jgi:two-component system chemotaxis response regulator CheB